MQILQPANITIPPNIYNIGLINRSVSGKSDRVLNVLEGILTGENIGEDREGGDKAILGLQNALQQSERYHLVLPALAPARIAGGLTSAEVHDICRQYKLDALIVLEYFDSNSIINVTQGKRNEKVKEETVEVIFYKANARLNVNTKWKMYDDSTGSIIDLYDSEDYLNFSNEGPNPDAARLGLPQKRYAINRTGEHAGKKYGTRIAPYWITVEREYFKKGSGELKQAAKFSKIGIWAKAIDIWKRETLNNNTTIAGRANYNMAIACEREGNLELALQYAKNARDQFGLAKAATYYNLLNKRLSDQQVLEFQLKRNQ